MYIRAQLGGGDTRPSTIIEYMPYRYVHDTRAYGFFLVGEGGIIETIRECRMRIRIGCDANRPAFHRVHVKHDMGIHTGSSLGPRAILNRANN